MQVDPVQDASSCSAAIIYVGSEEKFTWKTSEINLRNTFSGNFQEVEQEIQRLIFFQNENSY